jgi:glycosyltransferase involved in cell wall biosynthesis
MKYPQVLVITLSRKAYGGVANFNQLLFKYATLDLQEFRLLSGSKRYKIVSGMLFIIDILRLIIRLRGGSVDILHVNPSLVKNSIVRDGLFVLVGKIYGKKVYVHWHGWDSNKEKLLKKWFLKMTFFKSDHIRFLSMKFADKFKSLGYANSFSIGRTFFDDDIIQLTNTITTKTDSVRLLFLSTLSKNKGIYETLEVYKELSEHYRNIELVIAGKGPEYINVKKYISVNNLKKIYMVGFVGREKKYEYYLMSDIYILPSYYEGMPTSIIEAMVCGLPVVCTNVGALPEIIQDGKSGFIVNNLNNLKETLMYLIENPKIRSQISEFNKKYARSKFKASEAIKEIECEYLKI